MWLMGNLARATYVDSSNNVWPWSYDSCPASAAAYELQQEQEISACNNIQHYALLQHHGRGAPEIDVLEAMPGYTPPQDRHSHLGVTIRKPFFSSSFQVSPALTGSARPVPGHVPRFDPATEAGEMQRLADMQEKQQKGQEKKDRDRDLKAGLWDWLASDNSSKEGAGGGGGGSSGGGSGDGASGEEYTAWYDHGLSYGVNTTLNIYFYGIRLDATPNGAAYTTDSISSNTNLDAAHFDDFHTYTLEWQPKTYKDQREGKGKRDRGGDDDSVQTSAGWLAWYLDGQFLFRIDGDALDKSGAYRIHAMHLDLHHVPHQRFRQYQIISQHCVLMIHFASLFHNSSLTLLLSPSPQSLWQVRSFPRSPCT